MVVFGSRNQLGDGVVIPLAYIGSSHLKVFTCWEIRLVNHIINHSLQSQVSSIVRRINPGDAISLQFFDFLWQNNAPTTAEYLDMAATLFF